MSLANVLLIHVSSRYMPRNHVEEEKEQKAEYYHLLGLPLYAPVTEIRKSYRRLTLQMQCDRMMLEWNSEDNDSSKAKAALDEKEKRIKEAFHVLGDKHLRQQYHLLQCRTFRYGMIKGPLAIIQSLTQSRRWFPLLVLQSVIVASMINAIEKGYQTQEWVYVLIPAWSYYGLIVLFWLTMLEFPWGRHCTWSSFSAMFAAFLQHACLWNGCFWMARYWDRTTNPSVNWFILSIPFYFAILCRCYCTRAALDSLKELQSKMISRELFEAKQSTHNTELILAKDTPLPEGFIVVNKDSSAFSGLFLKLNDDEMQDPRMLEVIRVESSHEWRQVDYAAKALYRSALHLAILGSLFITLVALKLEDLLDISFWFIFMPVWIYLGMRLYMFSKRPRRVITSTVNNSSGNNNRTSTTNNSSGNNTDNTRENNPQSSPPAPSNHNETIAAAPSATATATEGSNENTTSSARSVDISSKSLSTGGYTAINVTMDVPTQSAGHNENNDSNGPTEKNEWSLVESIQLATTAGERDVEAAIPFTPGTEPFSADTTTQTSTSDSQEEGGGQAVSEEFERWQSVYETQEVRTSNFHLIPCEVLFHLLIVCLIVAKLDSSYENPSPEDSNFDAFFILLVPFSIGLIICCCALAVGILAINTDASPPTDAESNPMDAKGQPIGGANVDSDELAPMQAGAAEPREKLFATHLDIVKESTPLLPLLTAALPITAAQASTWLVENNDKSSSSSKTLWQQILQCAEDMNCQTANNDEEIPEIPSFDRECVLLLRENLEAHFDKTRFQASLMDIEPLDEENMDDADAENAIECPVCCEDYRFEDTVHCEGNPIHFFCRVCFHRYATETIQAGDIAGMPCADANCEANFSTPTVKANLSKWELLRHKDREQERNQKVALAAKAVLNCTCGAVGIVTDEEVGDGCINCPGEGCDKQFCALCGNHWHPETSCPPTKKMLQWVVQNTMPCPNCHTPIEKNFGCDHMHCAPPGGCGHHFSYKTGKPMSKHGRSLRGLYH